MKAGFQQQATERRQNEPMENRAPFGDLVVILAAGDKVRLMTGGEFPGQYVLVNRAQVGLVGAGVDTERIKQLGRSQRVESKLVRRERDAAAFAGQFALHDHRFAGRIDEIVAGFAPPDFRMQRFIDGIGGGRRLVRGNRLDQVLHPRGKKPLARQVAGKFGGGKIQQQHRAQPVVQ